MARKPTDTVHLNLRYPEAMRRRLEKAAKARGHSLNTEILRRLEQSFVDDDYANSQTVLSLGMLEVMKVVLGALQKLPAPPPPAPGGLLDMGRQFGLLDEPPAIADKKDESK